MPLRAPITSNSILVEILLQQIDRVRVVVDHEHELFRGVRFQQVSRRLGRVQRSVSDRLRDTATLVSA